MGRRERLAISIGVLIVLLSGTYLFAVLGPRVERERVQVLAHRGASAYAPENTLAAFRAALEDSGSPPVSEAAAAGRWLSEIFEPAVAAIPPELHGKRAAAEIFHELLEHRSQLSDGKRDVPLPEAIASYVENVLRAAPDERTAIVRDGSETG
jgi:hypothetical protein